MLSVLAVTALTALTALTPSAAQAASPPPATWPTLTEPPPKAVGGGKNDAAVIIGVESYLDLNPIPGAGANADAWADFLMSSRKVPEDRVQLLKNKSASLEGMRKAVARAAKEVGKGGTLWVVFIGHGAPAKDGSDGVLVGYDALLKTESLWARSLPRRELLAALAPAEARGAKPVVVLDACFSGKDASGRALVPGVQFSVPASLSSDASGLAAYGRGAVSQALVLSAGAANEVAGPLPGKTPVSRPAFSYLVLGGLRGWADGVLDDGRTDGSVTSDEVVRYARKVLRSLDPDREQVPEATGPAGSLLSSAGEASPDLRAMKLGEGGAYGGGVVAPGGSGGTGDMERALQDAMRKQAEADAAKREADRKAAEAERARQETQRAHRALVDADWATVQKGAKAGAVAARELAKVFLAKYAKDPMGNPHQAEAEALLAADAPAGEGSGGGAAPAGYVLVRPGRFTMGSPASEEGRDGDETPHPVTLTRAFLMKTTEVTQGEYEALMRNNPSYFKNCGRNCPVENVSWNDAVDYLNKLSDRERLPRCYEANGAFRGLDCKGYRLPTEAEWEYAARAGTTGARHGDVGEVAWYFGNSGSTTHPVGQKKPNAWGLYDMLGNVWEWNHDWFGAYAGDATDPAGAALGSSRVGRGGSWLDIAQFARAAYRAGRTPGDRGGYLGFRPVRTR